MPSTNVICFTLVLFLRQEVIKYRQIFMLRGDFFWVWNIISWFVKIALNWLFGTSLLIFWQLFNQLVWWNLFSQYFITVFKNSHYHLFWQLFFKTFFQNFILWLKQTLTKNCNFEQSNQPGLRRRFSNNVVLQQPDLPTIKPRRLFGSRGWLFLFVTFSFHERCLISIYFIKAFN